MESATAAYNMTKTNKFQHNNQLELKRNMCGLKRRFGVKIKPLLIIFMGSKQRIGIYEK